MKAKKSASWIVAAMAVVAVAGTVTVVEPTEPCTSCADCQAKLESGSYPIVELAADILDHPETCIDLDAGESDLVFDCAGHSIDGDEQSSSPIRGIAMYHGTGNTVVNCAITDFESAIYLVESSAMVVSDNHLSANKIGIDLSHTDASYFSSNTVHGSSTGIKISNSDDNTFESNSVCDNFPWDFYLASGTGNQGFDNICSSTWYWNDVGAVDCTFTCGIFSSGFETGDLGEWSTYVDRSTDRRQEPFRREPSPVESGL